MEIIGYRRSVIPACDVASLPQLEMLVEATCKVSGIGGYKIGLKLGLGFGLKLVVDTIKEQTNLPVIYDHQKAGNDIPEMGLDFAEEAKEAGVDAVILFPFAGPKTEQAWIKACREAGLEVLVGGHMTHEKFLASEGGFIDDHAPYEIYKIAAELGVKDFIVPGNKPGFVLKYREHLENILGSRKFTLYAPGFISQGGDISKTGQVAGENWHAIVGSAIYKVGGVEEMRQVAYQLTSQII